jgi:hypothetical protein
MIVEMQDDKMLSVEPKTIVGYSHSAVGGSHENVGFR